MVEGVGPGLVGQRINCVFPGKLLALFRSWWPGEGPSLQNQQVLKVINEPLCCTSPDTDLTTLTLTT